MGSPTIKDEATRKVVQTNVRKMLESLSLSENALSQRAKISQKHINNLTNARTGVGIDTLGYIARVFGVQTWFLMVPGAGDAFEDARRIAAITEIAVKSSPAVRIELHQHAKKLGI